MNILRYLLLRHPLASVAFLVSTLSVGTPLQVKAAQVIPQNQLKVTGFDSEQNSSFGALKTVDGDPSTIWRTRRSAPKAPFPHHITLQLPSTYTITGLRYLPRQDGQILGTVTSYSIYISTNGTSWGTAVVKGTWPETTAMKETSFTGKKGQYIRFVAEAAGGSDSYAAVAEINVLGTTGSVAPTPTSAVRKLSWVDNAKNEDGFNIERKVGPSGPFVRLAVVKANTTAYTDSNTQAGAVYCYRVQAFNTSGNSPFSNEACSTAPSTAPLVTSAPVHAPDAGNDRGIASSSQDKPLDVSQPPELLAVQIGVFRPGTASWYFDRNANGQFDGCATDTCSSSFGLTGDLPVVGDWNGTGISQIGVFSPSTHMWDLDANGNAQWDACEDDLCRGPFGKSIDLPISGYWQGKGSPAQIGVFRPQTGEWILDTNGNGRVDRRSDRDTHLGPFGTATDLPVVGDWTGTGKTRIGTFDPSTGQWRLDHNGNGVFDGCTIDRCAGPFGKSDSYPIAADWLGSGNAHIGVFDPASGMWQLDTNGNGLFDGCEIDQCVGPFGKAEDIPLVGQW